MSNPSTGREMEIHWISQHHLEFAGLWVALESDRLIASSRNPKEVFAAARARSDTPFVVYLEQEDIPFGGW